MWWEFHKCITQARWIIDNQVVLTTAPFTFTYKGKQAEAFEVTDHLANHNLLLSFPLQTQILYYSAPKVLQPVAMWMVSTLPWGLY